MDAEAIKSMTEIAQWVGLAAAGGAIGNSADRRVTDLVDWFKAQGKRPNRSWAKPDSAAKVASSFSSLSSEEFAQLAALFKTAQSVSVASRKIGRVVSANSTSGTAIGEVHGDVHIGRGS